MIFNKKRQLNQCDRSCHSLVALVTVHVNYFKGNLYLRFKEDKEKGKKKASLLLHFRRIVLVELHSPSE